MHTMGTSNLNPFFGQVKIQYSKLIYQGEFVVDSNNSDESWKDLKFWLGLFCKNRLNFL